MQYLFHLLLLMEIYSKSHSTPCEKGCDCREELKLATCTNALLTQLPNHIPPYTEHLDLSMNLLTFIPESSFQMERKLRVLLINDNNISAVADGAFTQLEISSLSESFSLGLNALRELQLSHNHLHTLDSRSFMHLDGLQRLNLTGNAIHNIQVRSFGSMSTLRQLHLEANHLISLNNGMFSMLKSLEVLNLQGNQINKTQEGVFTPMTSLALLNLAHNQMSTIYFKTFLSIHTYSTHILLEGNPWSCNCDLQRVFHKLRSVQRLFLDDYYNLSCNAPTELANYRLMDVDTELCIAEMVIVLIITITVVITVLVAIVMAERKRKKKKKRGKHWTEQGNLSDSDH
ncbi:hypothetical protein J4Q44_G00045160 [Coregonus suidteri]|uniref:LRRCT domain-containing protein n=1 Tax=Coregonus suidteri TaxID=861788 RepID=A0AAN8R6D8_9TELE